ncbi:MAG: hypothetical protein LPK20_11595 [Halomonas sp.]|jgi:hypothetical protein|uniref:Uncharacterized protein n=1 Tax=Billgrantia tianxiuensis TaxID=2497861 RepID=A0A6I6SVV1_9GAMM|nr:MULTISPECIES: hypothetical protein [Halomonas]MCE8033915.1 hypothetical protein [Halomonas sp. MCCC 1A11057]MDX5434202.1 hypothetical protein [Halomonas sp.]QHC51463.1 hypothetical protein EKK97_20245 [Halomonas tianxiuensis]
MGSFYANVDAQRSGTHLPRDSQDWQHALDQALAAHGGPNALALYPHVAFAFPSSSPNPYTREYPLLDYRELKEWANSRGWRVRPAPERAPDGEKYSPPVRFTRVASRYH